MTRPHPVVCISSKFTYIAWRCTYQTHIVEYFIHIHEILIPIVERLNHSLIMSSLNCFLTNCSYISFNQLFSFFSRNIISNALQYLFGYIFHINQQSNAHSSTRQLFLLVFCPKTICQIVMFYSTMPNYATITAMVICQKQTFSRHKLTCTTTTEQNYRIFQRRLICTVNILSRNLHSILLHICLLVCQQQRQPHTFVSNHLTNN